MVAAYHLAVYKPGTLKHLDVLRSGVERDGEIDCKLSDTRVRLCQSGQDRASRRVSDSSERCVKLGSSIFTHGGEYIA